ncbi:PAS domain S-box protein [Acidisoma cellulosilytica]|uniref:histidine kinase n=1 Tax=Acidisoma cellulosilyticum TaxID=2802395 RepID=A0A963Z6W2_9PROT|nr:ATP-binding protein [Acidisoma cellulosilyticum]MCB8883190.1 PAS domain S-box protein [Acidisoma cellulosilyticum]
MPRRIPAAHEPAWGILPVITGLVALLIFAIDTLMMIDFAVAVLYVTVVMLAPRFTGWRGIIAISAGCVMLTATSFAMTHLGMTSDAAIGRCIVSMLAIGIATALVLRNAKGTASLQEQASLLDLTHDAILVRDRQDIITYWGQGAEELYGWERKQAIGQSASILLQTKFHNPLDEVLAEFQRTGRWNGEVTHTRRDGTEVHVVSRWSLKSDRQGQPTATMETNNDITERRRAEDALHASRAELAHMNRVMILGELTASIAHEVNQPLAAIVTNGQACNRWLKRGQPDLPEALIAVERMIANAQRASDVVARLRDLARRSTPDYSSIDFNGVILDTATLLNRELTSHNVSLHLDLASDFPRLYGDRIQLQQVLINLIVNGCQAMDGVPIPDRALSIVTGFGRDHAPTVEVQDRGKGVPADMVGKLFDPFYSTKRDGMGMGLSISRSILEAHGGRIWVNSTLGQGSQFCLEFPIINGDAA